MQSIIVEHSLRSGKIAKRIVANAMCGDGKTELKCFRVDSTRKAIRAIITAEQNLMQKTDYKLSYKFKISKETYKDRLREATCIIIESYL